MNLINFLIIKCQFKTYVTFWFAEQHILRIDISIWNYITECIFLLFLLQFNYFANGAHKAQTSITHQMWLYLANFNIFTTSCFFFSLQKLNSFFYYWFIKVFLCRRIKSAKFIHISITFFYTSWVQYCVKNWNFSSK